jgi:hypothetical protein
MARVKVYPGKDFAQTPNGLPGSRISCIGRGGAEGNAVGCCRRHVRSGGPAGHRREERWSESTGRVA